MLYAYVKWYRSPDYSTTRGVAIDSSGDTSLSVIYLISGEVLDETNNVFKHKISLISEEQLEGNGYNRYMYMWNLSFIHVTPFIKMQ